MLVNSVIGNCVNYLIDNGTERVQIISTFFCLHVSPLYYCSQDFYAK